ncbi:GyrI-like domain-containing protein [Paenibacillus sp. 32352]|uniref:GyrI-like domain-containing protein n=1 Tax=Paenibacillus sp. 32352 TaxID=1969111 RepID=UPI00277B4B9F|nr:GyrI-like domain-containing protein [Paenibacillus sp. 32352]
MTRGQNYRKTGPDTFPYILRAFKDEASNTEGYTSVTIPAHTWAIFPSEPHPWNQFDETIETLYKRFYTEWLPTAGYEQVRRGIEFKMYGAKDGLNYIELWFAVRKA